MSLRKEIERERSYEDLINSINEIDKEYLEEYKLSDYRDFKESILRNEGGHIYDRFCEASIGRVFAHAQKGFVMLSAYQVLTTEMTLDERTAQTIKNKKNHERLKNEFGKRKIGFFVVNGFYTYKNKYSDKELQNHELSLFVPYDKRKFSEEENFLAFARRMARKYKQESMLLKLSNDDRTILLYKDGEIDPQGNFHPDKMGKYYSTMRFGKKRAQRHFTFRERRILKKHKEYINSWQWDGIQFPASFNQHMSFDTDRQLSSWEDIGKYRV